MGKVKHRKTSNEKQAAHSSKSKHQLVHRRQHSQNGKFNLAAGNIPKTSSPKSNKQPLKQRKTFIRSDRVLLVGEGDFSFALSLARHHESGSIVATSYDDAETVSKKYPDIGSTLRALNQGDQNGSNGRIEKIEGDEDEWQGFSSTSEQDESTENVTSSSRSKRVVILHGIDATSLSKAHKKTLNHHAPFTKIVFNFPHTGGLSTDVNRQVRANQELLVNFFNAAKPLVATTKHPARPRSPNSDDPSDDEVDFDLEHGTIKNDQHDETLSSGQILVTLFEGEPYTLWNIRDLARHCGLQVIESFKFDWSAYPGYRHARTIGDITSGKDRSDEGKRKGAWRGEERDARCYVLGLKEEVAKATKGRERKQRDDSDESD